MVPVVAIGFLCEVVVVVASSLMHVPITSMVVIAMTTMVSVVVSSKLVVVWVTSSLIRGAWLLWWHGVALALVEPPLMTFYLVVLVL